MLIFFMSDTLFHNSFQISRFFFFMYFFIFPNPAFEFVISYKLTKGIFYKAKGHLLQSVWMIESVCDLTTYNKNFEEHKKIAFKSLSPWS